MDKTASLDAAAPDHDALDEIADTQPGIPAYLEKNYWWAYLNPGCVRFFEHQWIVNLILWGNFPRLRDAALAELGSRVVGRTLQIACVYGDFTPKLAARLAPPARLDVVDVAPIQLTNLRAKMGDLPHVHLHRQDASDLSFPDRTFDQVVLFFLLHELPDDVRRSAVAEALRVVKPGGRVVFVDYHRPVWPHPHRYLMYPILKTLEPFALDLWRNEIADCVAADQTPSEISKNTFFGGLYQRVVMTR